MLCSTARSAESSMSCQKKLGPAGQGCAQVLQARQLVERRRQGSRQAHPGKGPAARMRQPSRPAAKLQHGHACTSDAFACLWPLVSAVQDNPMWHNSFIYPSLSWGQSQGLSEGLDWG